MIDVEIEEPFDERVLPALILEAAEATLKHQQVTAEIEVSIVITGDEQVHELNQSFRDVNAPTDVLSFPSGSALPPVDGDYLGDMILSFERAESQALQAGHSVNAEIQLLTVHGLLHLLGHDHYDADEKAAMWNAQAEVLQAIGCEISGPSLDE